MTSQAEPGYPTHFSPLNVAFVSEAGVMTFLSTCLVVTRFISRYLTISIKRDDWFCLLALIFAYGFLCTATLGATVGHSGFHITEYKDPLVLERYFQIVLANNVFYNISVGLSKISILLFYQRIFSINKTFLRCTWVIAGLSVGACTAAVCGLIFAYTPVDAQWQFWKPSTTIDNKSFWIAMGVVNILLDAIILALPQPVVWRLNQTRHRRILLSLVFSVGGFTCVTSVVRLFYMATVEVNDLTYTFIVPGIWTNVETNMSIICSCLPMIPNLVQHIRSSRSTRGGSSPKWSGMTYARPFRNWKSIFSSSTLERYHGDGSRQGLYSDLEMANSEEHTDHLGDVPKIQVKMEFLQNWDPVTK
ncbi:hypothetical protein BO83DRAFT_439260 [Aspergillus eucalypticola CBS 122712]|uniref:Rhodopsin domain-containing protein n=1 Tax=Aspergillus eucalypticola (strain CBS 122712 / IBT 29274) TaxID=1448314 RepID=A0A317V5R8_ASPEC|nr:uncharacterized protein BO83DRAFT_439260 [Aspergillus eucalypticola CBS 122712]PWY68378.1 hypothetical protein BO83DRAFT_439260 [Aspergillus eucalypticola CBS 122712]